MRLAARYDTTSEIQIDTLYRKKCIDLVGWGIKDTTYGKSNKYIKNYSMTRQRKHLAGWSRVHVQ
jgi:hypothetical protein